MLVVAIESAADAAGVAIADGSAILAEVVVSNGRKHAETITPAIRYCFEAASAHLRDVDAIGVDVGPGLFTGLRVGVGTAKALAYALRRPVVALGSLAILARAAAPVGIAAGASVVAVLDARRSEVVSDFAGVPAADSDEPPDPEHLETPESLALRLRAVTHGSGDAKFVLVGDGALRYRETFEDVPGVTVGDRWLASPPVSVLAEMAVELALAGAVVDAAVVRPRYVRQADARINWAVRASRSGVTG